LVVEVSLVKAVYLTANERFICVALALAALAEVQRGCAWLALVAMVFVWYSYRSYCAQMRVAHVWFICRYLLASLASVSAEQQAITLTIIYELLSDIADKGVERSSPLL
jgi:hypothetical protein